MLRAALALIAVLALAGCGSKAADVSRDGDGRPTEAGPVRADRLRVGDCFDDTEDQTATDYPVRPCGEPHANEVFLSFEVKAPGFPGVAALTDEATARCEAAFPAYVGRPLEGSAFKVFEIIPSEDTWEHDGDRTVLCAVFAADLRPVRGSAEGSER